MKRTMFMGVAIATIALTSSAIAQQEWYPSKYGKDDTIGAANNLSKERTKEAAGTVTEGKIYRLGMVVSQDSLAYPPRTFQIVITQSNDGTGSVLGENKVTANDDLIMSYMGISSQIDGLGHLGIDHRYYNGIHASDFVTPTGLTELGTHKIPPIATRGILLDMAAYYGVDTVEAGTAYNKEEIVAVAEKQGVEIKSGDVVIFHSGWHRMLPIDGQKWLTQHPGPGVEGAQYLADLGVVAVGADSAAVEVIPFENEDRPFEVHQTLLAKNGVYILENMMTSELAADGVHEFMFVLGQPLFKGAVQMVINPVAIK